MFSTLTRIVRDIFTIGGDTWGESSRQARLPGGPAAITVTAPGPTPYADCVTTAPAMSFVVVDTTISGWGHDGVYTSRAAAERTAARLPGREVMTWREFAREARDSSDLVQVTTGGRVRALDI